MSKMKPNVVNFDGERWYYRKRELVGFTVKYGKVSGFSSKEDACAARDAVDAAFQMQLAQLYGKQSEDVLFVDFMMSKGTKFSTLLNHSNKAILPDYSRKSP